MKHVKQDVMKNVKHVIHHFNIDFIAEVVILIIICVKELEVLNAFLVKFMVVVNVNL